MSDPADPPPADDGTRDLQPSDWERTARDLEPGTGAWVPTGNTSLPPAAPQRIGRFEVRRLLGEGAFGRVYLAFDPQLHREVAIKLPSNVALTPEFREQFLREARATAKIHHANVCPVYEAGEDGDRPYIVMRFVAGGSLADLLKRGPLPLPDAIRVATQLALGLEAAHAKGVIHRDLKPANVLYDEVEREMLVADFGLARLADQPGRSSTGIKGTPRYMSPEQWGDGDEPGAVGPLTDVYSLGVILYELLTGALPFRGSTLELMLDHIQKTPQPPSSVRPGLDPRVDALCLKSLAKNPADRYRSAKEFARALGDCLRRGEQVGPTAPVVQKINLTVPGEWFVRPANDPNAKWLKVAETPAEITIVPENVYRLSVRGRASDRELQGLEELKGLPALRELDLAGCWRLTDAGLVHLKGFTALRLLCLSDCEQLTDTSFLHLKKLPALQELDLAGCGRLTDAGIAALQQALPNCEIKR